MRSVLLLVILTMFGLTSTACDTVMNVQVSSILNNSAVVSWSPATGATYYEVWYRVSPSGNWNIGTSSTSSKLLTGLTANTLYDVAVASYCVNVPSNLTTTISFQTTNSNNPGPNPCDSVTAVVVSNITATSALASWNAVAGATYYNVYRKQLPSGNWILSTATSPSKLFSGLTPNTSYAIWVQTACGNDTSVNTTATQFTTDTMATPPPVICDSVTSVLITNITNTTATVNWNAVPGAAYYHVSIRQLPSGSWVSSTSSATSKVYNNLLINTAYEVLIRTNCNPDTSTNNTTYNFSTTNVIIPPTPCDSATSVTIGNITTTGATVSWNPVAGASYYNIFTRALPAGNWVLSTSSAATKVLTGLTPNTTYAVLVQTACGNDTSTNQTTVTFITDTLVIPPPSICDSVTSVTFTNVTNTTATANWNAVAGAAYYYVYIRQLPAGAWIQSTAAATSKVYNNLTINTSYEVLVRTVCNPDTSTNTMGYTFATTNIIPPPPVCDSITNITFTNITNTTATATWNAAAGAAFYYVYIRQLPAGAWTQSTSAATTKVFTNLTINTSYEVLVRTFCNPDSSTNTLGYSFATTNIIPPPPVCDSITNMTFTNVTNTTATATWNAAAGAAYYYVYIRELPAGAWTQSTSAATTKVFTNLTINTSYEVLVRTFCNPDSSTNTLGYSFATTNIIPPPPVCDSITNMTFTNVTNTTATASWNAAAGAAYYYVYIRELPAGAWSQSTSASTTKVFTNLTINTSYEVLVRTYCNPDSTSNTLAYSFATTNVINPPTPCDSTTSVAVSSITTTGATLNWTAVTGASYYNIFTKQLPSGNWVLSTATTNSKILTGLIPNTAYAVLVQTACNNDTSTNTIPVIFTTDTIVIPPPTVCDSVTGITFSGITNTDATVSWTGVTGAAYYLVFIRELPAGNWNMSTSTSTSKTYTNLTINTSYEVLVRSYCNPDTSNNTLASSFTTTNIINPPTPCDSVTNVTVTGITDFDAVVNWTAVAGASWYNVSYRLLPSGNWNYVSSNTNTKALTGLAAGSTYAVLVRTYCNNDSSTNVAVKTFTTTNTCLPPTNIWIEYDTAYVGDITAHWTSSPNADYSIVRLKPTSSTTWNTGTSNSNSKSYNLLNVNTSYDLQVADVCQGVNSAFSPTFTFIINSLPVGVSNLEARETYSIYPNPANNEIHIGGSPSSNLLSEISIVDISGRVIMKKNRVEVNQSISIESLHPGIYTLQLVDSKENTQRLQFVKY
jgi:hypothetical protein